MRFVLVIMIAALGCSDTQNLLAMPDAACDASSTGDVGTPADTGSGDDAHTPREDASSPDDATMDGGAPPDATLPMRPPVPTAPPALMETCIPGILGRDLAIGADGTLVVAGSFRGTLAFGDEEFVAVGRSSDGIVATLSADGAPRWAMPLGGRDSQGMRAVDVSPTGEITVVGQFRHELDVAGTHLVSAGNYDGVVARFSRTGALSWTRHFGGPEDDFASDVEVTGTQATVAGAYTGELALSPDPSMAPALSRDAFVARLDGTGAALSARGFGGGGMDVASALAVTADRTAMIGRLWDLVRDTTGEIASSTRRSFTVSWDETEADDDFVELYSENVTVDAVDLAEDGELVVAGRFEHHGNLGTGPLAGGAERGIFVARLTSSGAILWARGFAGSASARTVSFVGDEQVVVTGNFGSLDFGAGALRRSGEWNDAYVGWLTADGEVSTAYAVESELGYHTVPHVVTEDGTLWLAIDQMHSVDPDPRCIGLRILALPAPE